MKNPIKILHLEDVKTDAELVSMRLTSARLNFIKKLVNTRQDFENALEQFHPDVILCDHSLPSFNSLEALRITRQKGWGIPFILVTGAVSEEFAVKIIQEGADDYILKDRMERLPTAIAQSVQKYFSEREKKDMQERFMLTLNSLKDYAIFQLDAEGHVLSWNQAAENIKGFKGAEIIGKKIDIFYTEEDLRNLLPAYNLRMAAELGKYQTIGWRKKKNGTIFFADILITALRDDAGALKGYAKITRDITERKIAEEQIRKSEVDLSNIFHRSLDMICTTDEEGRFIKVSAAATAILGYTPEELIGRRYIDLVLADDIEKTIQIAEQIQAGLNVTMFENRFVKKDGSIAILIWSAYWDKNENVMYSVARDATEKVRMEQAFENERRRFEDLFLNTPTCMCILSGTALEFKVTNPGYLAMVGKKDLIGKSAREVFPEAKDQGLFEIIDNVYRTGISYSAKEMLIRLTNDEGELRDVYLNFIIQAYRNALNEVEGVFCFCIDVTEQVQSRKKIEQSEEKYRQIVETAQEGIWVIDAHDKITFVNERICAMLEYSKVEMLMKPIQCFMDAQDREIAAKAMERTRQGISENFELVFMGKTGKRWTNISTTPIYKDNIYAGALHMLTDITIRKRSEQETLLLVQRLHTKNKDLEQFAYMVSHNLRAPIAKILGLASVLEFSKDTAMIVEKIAEETTSLDNVVKDMNVILTLRDGDQQNSQKIVFVEELQAIQRVLEHEIKQSKAEITYSFIPSGMSTVKGKFYSILYNLLSNAIKYRSERPLKIHVEVKPEDNHLCLSVTDNGCGIDLDQYGDKLFMLYKRFHGDMAPGKGIGLNLVKVQAESLRGWVKVESEVDKGSTFKVYFSRNFINRINAHINHIYLIDDDKLCNAINKRMLAKHASASIITVFPNATEALAEIVRTFEAEYEMLPDIIFLDLSMPVMDGWQFLQELEKLPEVVVEKCKVVILSSSIDEAEVQRSKDHRSVYNFISKPLTPQKLLDLFSD